MNRENKPMPLSELPAYMDHIKKHGQGGDVPVVDVGIIVDESPIKRWARPLSFAVAASLMIGICGYAVKSTKEITIVSDLSEESAVLEKVSNDGGRVISVRKDEKGRYKVRIFTFMNLNSLVGRLRENKEFRSVELEN